jgi:putative transposase
MRLKIVMEIKTPQKEYHHSSHSVYSCIYHVIICPKYRRKVLDEEIAKRLNELLREKIKEFDSNFIELEIMEDHVHMLVDVNPDFGIKRVVQGLKGYSSRILRKEFPKLKSRIPCLWTRGKFISSVGSVQLDVVKKYIENQKHV